MGTIKTTNIEPIADNGTVTLGSSGDTFTVPSGVTVNMSSATQTGVGGLQLITSTTFSSVSSVTVDSCFTSTFVNYHVLFNADWGSVTDTDLRLNFRASSSTDSNSSYNFQSDYINANNNSGVASQSNTATHATIFDNADTEINGRIEFYNPQLSNRNTYFESLLLGHDGSTAKKITGFGEFDNTTSFDGFILTGTAGTFTGRIQVFGYRQ